MNLENIGYYTIEALDILSLMVLFYYLNRLM